ncbi:MAG: thioredoxin domain-containing protein [Rickettsiales bacterium]|jgi:protein-disulfide isomerase|nr:thioredoxin domain-containing protein [Rickettsiales bacterium]
MLLTILILAVAVAAFLFAGKVAGISKKQSEVMLYAQKAVSLVAVVLVVWGVNRTGLGTQYYLTQVNPMILQEMVESMREIQTNSSSKELKKYVSKNAKEMEANAPVLGNEGGSKTIFLFSDYTCPYCQRVHGELMRVIADDPEVRVVLKNFSVHGIMSDIPAQAVIAAKLQGNDKAAKLDALLTSNTKWYDVARTATDQSKAASAIFENVMKLAKDAGLDAKRLEKDMKEAKEVQIELYQVRELSQKFNISGTPFLIINNQAFPGAIPYDQIRAALAR